MAGPNTTGITNTEDYLIGRGKIYFAPLDATTNLPTNYRFLGNAPSFTVTPESETLEHFDSTAGLKSVDKEVVISQKLSLAFALDEFNAENLALVMSGDQAAPVNAAVLGFTSLTLVEDGDIVKARSLDIRNAAGLRAYDVNAADLDIKTTNGSPVDLVLNTDYTVDEEMGTVFLSATSSILDTAISGTEGLTLVLTAKPGAKGVTTVQGATQTSVSGALKFVSDNAASTGAIEEWQFHKLSIKGEGDVGLIGDEFGEMAFTAVAEKNNQADADSPTLTITKVSAT